MIAAPEPRSLQCKAASRWVLHSDDIDEQASMLPDWPQEYIQLEPGTFASRVEGVDLAAPIGLFRKSTNRRMYKRFAAPDRMLGVAILGPHSDPVVFQGREAGPGHGMLLPPSRFVDVVCHGRMDVSVVLLPTDRVAARCGRAEDLTADVIEPGASLRRMAHWIEHLMERPGCTGAWALERELHGVLAERPRMHPARTSNATLVETARQLVLEQAEFGEAAVTLGQLAAQLDVSLRWLHHAFSRHFGMPPGQFAQRLRLARARADLRAHRLRDPSGGSVTEVALKWGFSHFGRFAQAYRQAYGELPSQTLRGLRLAA